MKFKLFVLATCLVFVVATIAEAQKYSGGSKSGSSASRPSSSSGGSKYSGGRPSTPSPSFSRPSTPSTPKYSGGSRPSTPSPSFSRPSTPSTPKYSGGSSRPSTPSTPTTPSTPKYSGSTFKPSTPSTPSPSTSNLSSKKPESRPSTSGGLSEKARANEQQRAQRDSGKPITGFPDIKPSGVASDKPNTNTDTATSKRPESRPASQGGMSEKARANEQQRAQRQYVETQKAVQPPKSSYTTAEGKTVNINPQSPVVETIRSKPSTYYQPQAIQQRTEVHFHNYRYSNPYNWYYSQPTVYIGGGWNSALWYMMMEWDAERRARWLYHNRYEIEADAYNRGLHDAKVAAEIQKLEAAKVARQAGYVDPEFAQDPSIIMDQNYINAAYNPAPVTPVIAQSGGGMVVIWVLLGGLVLVGIVWLVFFKRWN